MNELKFALKVTFPIFFAYLFLGIAFGILMTDAGFSFFTSIVCSVFIYAGSLQIVMVSLLKAGTPLIIVAVMSFFINGRHIFYGLGFIKRFRESGWRYPYLVFSLTDETYSILCSVDYPKFINRSKTDFLISLFDQSYWILGTVLGACVGNFLPFDMKGIDFSATAFFLIVVINQLQKYKSKIPAFVGILSSVLFYFIFGPEYFLIPALSASLIALIILRDFVNIRMSKVSEDDES
ncbi:MAG: AzlC family ABC transporter permease [Treponema sp.]|nr:AzlC family ABC transporter permease [Treponema sp.]